MPSTKKAAVVIDKYKLKVFEDAFRRAGFKWSRNPGLTPGTLTLKVEFDNTTFDKLSKVVDATNEVAKAQKKSPRLTKPWGRVSIM